MTTDEIEKAVKDYADYSTLDSYLLLKLDFRNGVEFANKHWQEKTRWKSIETAPPKLPSNPSEEKQVLIKHAKGGYDVKFLVKQSSIDYWLKEGFVFWKEIE